MEFSTTTYQNYQFISVNAIKYRPNNTLHNVNIPIVGRNQDVVEYFSNLTTFPFHCTYLCYNIQLKNAKNV